jgi:hypothetical protein
MAYRMPNKCECGEEILDDETICVGCWSRFSKECPGCREFFYAPKGERSCNECLDLLRCRVCGTGSLGPFEGDLCDKCRKSLQSTCFNCLKEFYEPDFNNICPYCHYNCYTECFACLVCSAELNVNYADSICAPCKHRLSKSELTKVRREAVAVFPGSVDVVVGCGEAEKIALQIFDLEGDVQLLEEATFIVGKQIGLKVTNTVEAAMYNVRWSLGGQCVRDYSVAQGGRKEESYGRVVKLSPIDLGGEEVFYHYICPGTVSISVQADVHGKRLSAAAIVTVLAPTRVEVVSKTTAVKIATVKTDFGKSLHLTFGGDTVTRRPGIKWTCTAKAPLGGAGEIACTQLIRINRMRKTSDGKENLLSSQKKYVLDEVLHYDINPEEEDADSLETVPLPEEETISIVLEDSPAMPLSRQVAYSELLNDAVAIDDDFKVYFMYRPEGEDSIWVTLSKFEWFCRGRAVYIKSKNAWELRGAIQSDNPKGIPSCELPVWEGNRDDYMK